MNVETPPQALQTLKTAANPRLTVWSIITSLTSGGAETLVASLNSYFAKDDVEHVVIALCDAETLGNSPDTERRMAQQIESQGGKSVSLKLNRWRDPFNGGRAINRLLREGVPGVIHAHTARARPMISASRFKGAVVLTHHNSRLSFPKVFFRHLDSVVDSYVAISAETEDIYRSQCRKPAIRISNGVSGGFFADGARKASRKPATIISVGAISEQKNYDLLLETARQLRTSNDATPIATFKIAGPGDRLAEYRIKVEQWGLSGVVEFLGERSDVPELLADADMFLNTSNYEGQSVAMLEAMAMALPVVATDVPGNRDLVSHERNGLLVHHNDPQTLAESIADLIANPSLYSRLSAGARETGQQFSAAKTATAHLDLYRSFAPKG